MKFGFLSFFFMSSALFATPTSPNLTPVFYGYDLGATTKEKVHIVSVACRSGVKIPASTIDILVLFTPENKMIQRYFVEFRTCVEFQEKQVDSGGSLVSGQIGDIHFDGDGNVDQIYNLQSQASFQ